MTSARRASRRLAARVDAAPRRARSHRVMRAVSRSANADARGASSLSRAREANARQRAAFARFASERRDALAVASPSRARELCVARGGGADGNLFVESFFDLANVVAGGRDVGSGGHTRLAERIGEDVYVQVNAWRLYARDMKFHDGLAKVFAVKIAANGNKMSDALVEEVLGTVRVPLGGGKSDARLVDLCPSASVAALKNILRDYVDDRL